MQMVSKVGYHRDSSRVFSQMTGIRHHREIADAKRFAVTYSTVPRPKLPVQSWPPPVEPPHQQVTVVL